MNDVKSLTIVTLLIHKSSHTTSVSSCWAHNHQSRVKRGIGMSMKHGGSGDVMKETSLGDESPGYKRMIFMKDLNKLIFQFHL